MNFWTESKQSVPKEEDKSQSKRETRLVMGLGNNGKVPRSVSFGRKIAMKGKRVKGARGGSARVTTRGPPRGAEVVKTWNLFSGSKPFLKNQIAQYNKPYYVSEQIAFTNLYTTSVTVDTGGALYFTLAQINDVTNLGLIFDQYKIIRVEVWLQYTSGAATSSQDMSTQFVSAVDYDDANVVTPVNTINDYENSISTSLAEGHYHSFVPHVAVAAYSGAFTSFANEAAPWIDVASNTVQHYGLKSAATSSLVVGAVAYAARLHVLFRSLR